MQNIICMVIIGGHLKLLATRLPECIPAQHVLIIFNNVAEYRTTLFWPKVDYVFILNTVVLASYTKNCFCFYIWVI